MRAARGLSTVSVRTRVTVGVIAVVAVTLVLVSLAVSALFAAQSERNLDALLSGRLQLARQLARSGSGPQQIVNRVTTDGVQAQLVLRNGSVFGTAPPLGTEVRSVSTTLNGTSRVDGAELTLAVDASLVRDAQRQLRRLLLGTSAAAVLLSAILVAVTVRLALRPLDTVAGLARSISEGRRGSRLHPQRTDTEIGQTAAALDEMLDELEGAEWRARQAEERSRTFLADAAHELRTPLAGIQAAAETLLHSADQLDRAERQQLEVLLIREARRAGGLVSDLLAAARLDAGVELHRSPLSLGALATAEIDRARLLAPQAQVRLLGDDMLVSADADKVAGIVRNLMDNAIRAAGPTGHVTVVTGSGNGWAFLDVTDSGPGVPPTDRERVFDRLVRLDSGRAAGAGGSGLGLAIARGWARAHGGDLVCLETEDGRGARFRLSLPATPAPAGAQAMSLSS